MHLARHFARFIRPWKDPWNIWVKKATEPFGAARLVTADTRRRVYAVDPSAAAAAGQEHK
jgi:hypothetical protein